MRQAQARAAVALVLGLAGCAGNGDVAGITDDAVLASHEEMVSSLSSSAGDQR